MVAKFRMQTRQGTLLMECIVSLVILSATLNVGYQMISGLQHESKRLLAVSREREKHDFIWRLTEIAPKMTRVRISKEAMSFNNGSGDRCVIRLQGDRIVYLKNNRGQYVMCTDVRSAMFERTPSNNVGFDIHFKDGSVIKGESRNRITEFV